MDINMIDLYTGHRVLELCNHIIDREIQTYDGTSMAKIIMNRVKELCNNNRPYEAAQYIELSCAKYLDFNLG